MKLGVVGSRDFADLNLVHGLLRMIYEELCVYEKKLVIVSGGAAGVDSAAEKFADKNSLEKIVFIPDWTLGKHAGFLRNADIVNASDFVIAFWDYKSRGTADSVKKAEDAGKLLCIVKPSGDIHFKEIGKEILAFIYSGEGEPVDDDGEFNE